MLSYDYELTTDLSIFMSNGFSLLYLCPQFPMIAKLLGKRVLKTPQAVPIDSIFGLVR